MGFSCEHFPKVCPSCAAQKSLIPALPANTEATILKEGWRSCPWQLARQDPGSEISRAFAACLDSEAGRCILAKDIPRPDITPQSCNRLVTRLAHDDEFPNAIHRSLGDASRAEGVPAERINIHSGPRCSPLQELSNRVFVQTAPRYMTISTDRPEDETVGNSGSGEPLPERADRTRILAGSEGQTHFSSGAGIIVVLRKNKPKDRKGKIVLVNASQQFRKGAAKELPARGCYQENCGWFLKGKAGGWIRRRHRKRRGCKKGL